MPYAQVVHGTLDADGDSIIITLRADNETIDSGFYLHLSGDFGSGTAQVKYESASGTWLDLAGGSFTEPVDKIIFLPNDRQFKISLNGSTSANLFYEISASGTSVLET